MIIKMSIELGRKTDEHTENFNKEIENIRKYQLSEDKITILTYRTTSSSLTFSKYRGTRRRREWERGRKLFGNIMAESVSNQEGN